VATASRSSRAPGTGVFATIASFAIIAIIAIASAMWRTERHDTPAVAPHIERKLRVSAFQPVSARAAEDPVEDTLPSEEAPPLQNEPMPPPAAAATADPDIPATPPEQPTNEGIITDES
jgi:hypothetical protein